MDMINHDSWLDDIDFEAGRVRSSECGGGGTTRLWVKRISYENRGRTDDVIRPGRASPRIITEDELMLSGRFVGLEVTGDLIIDVNCTAYDVISGVIARDIQRCYDCPNSQS